MGGSELVEDVAVGQSKEFQKPQLHVSDIVQSLNRFCWQKQAGGFTLPKQVDSKYCILCNNGCTCFGVSCKGIRPAKVSPTRKFYHPPNVIPGFEGNPNLTTNSLKTITMTSSSRKCSIPAISLRDPIFNPSPSKVHSPPVPQPVNASSQNKSPIPFQPQRSPQVKSSKVNSKLLRSILLRSSLSVSKTKQEKTKEHPQESKTSMLRKLSVSEQRCLSSVQRSFIPPCCSTPILTAERMQVLECAGEGRPESRETIPSSNTVDYNTEQWSGNNIMNNNIWPGSSAVNGLAGQDSWVLARFLQDLTLLRQQDMQRDEVAISFGSKNTVANMNLDTVNTSDVTRTARHEQTRASTRLSRSQVPGKRLTSGPQSVFPVLVSNSAVDPEQSNYDTALGPACGQEESSRGVSGGGGRCYTALVQPWNITLPELEQASGLAVPKNHQKNHISRESDAGKRPGWKERLLPRNMQGGDVSNILVDQGRFGGDAEVSMPGHKMSLHQSLSCMAEAELAEADQVHEAVEGEDGGQFKVEEHYMSLTHGSVTGIKVVDLSAPYAERRRIDLRGGAGAGGDTFLFCNNITVKEMIYNFSPNTCNSTESSLSFYPSLAEEDSLSSLRELELLRHGSPNSSPNTSLRTPVKRRAQSNSPPDKDRSKSRTPRKDTPKKIKRSRVQCRNIGCKDSFVSDKTRVLHETKRCKHRPYESQENVNKSFEIPSHCKLNLEETVCRFPGCDRVFIQKASRKRHEQEQHSYVESKGRTHSPVPFSSPTYSDSGAPRPQSCPPDFRGFRTPTSTRRSSGCTTPLSDDDLAWSPQLSFTPPPSSPLPSSSLTPPPSSQLPRSLFVVPDSHLKSMTCPYCQFQFQGIYKFRSHACKFRPDLSLFNLEANITTINLVKPKAWRESKKIISSLCQEDQVKLCMLNNWAMPGLYPFVFPRQARLGRKGIAPIFDEMTASTKSQQLLRKLVNLEKSVKLPKYILVKDESTGVSSYLSDAVLMPRESFDVDELDSSFILVKASNVEEDLSDLDRSDNEEEDMEQNMNDLLMDSDDCEDQVFHFHGPLPPVLDEFAEDDAAGWSAGGSVRGDGSVGGEDTDRSVGGGNRRDTLGDGAGHDEWGVPDDGGIEDSGEGANGRGGGLSGGAGGGGGSDNGGADGGGSDDEGGAGGGGGSDNGDAGGSGSNDGGGEDINEDNSGDGGEEGRNTQQELSGSRTGVDRMELLSNIRDLLSDSFEFGCDGMGSVHFPRRQAASLFRNPLKLSPQDFINLVKITKEQFLGFVTTCIVPHNKKINLSSIAQSFLMLVKLMQDISYAVLSTLFALSNRVIGRNIFWEQVMQQWVRNCSVPCLLYNGDTVQTEVSKLLHGAYTRTPVFYQKLVEDFEDPSGLDRLPVILNLDGTYFDIQRSSDLELQKYLYYLPRSGHTVKFLNFTDMSPKFLAFLPVATSQSPSSGDGLLIAQHIEIQEGDASGQYVRALLRGNHQFFVILVVDAGFVTTVPNAPREARRPTAITLSELCEQEDCVMLHTSNKALTYHLQRTPAGKIVKVPRADGTPTLDENAVKFTRLLRKTQEQIHAALKQKFPFLNLRKLWLDCLKPFTSRQLVRFGLDAERFKDSPRLNFLVTVCCSLINFFHPGFRPHFMKTAQDQTKLASIILKRLFLENPLLHPEIWPVELKPASNDRVWTDISFAEFENAGHLNFPQLTQDNLIPAVFEIASGANAIKQANSSITYMRQIQLKGQNLSRSDTEAELVNPPSEWRLKYLKIQTPDNFITSEQNPSWEPDWWDERRFGHWNDLTFVGCRIPPSNKSANPSNYHWAIIGFGSIGTDRLGLDPPYNRIYFFRCFGCPALNGSISMDRHLAALLQLCSFIFLYKPTNRTVNLLNTVADGSRQATHILPQSASVEIPIDVTRRGRDRRLNHPLYGGPSSPQVTSGVPGIPVVPLPHDSSPSLPQGCPSAPTGEHPPSQGQPSSPCSARTTTPPHLSSPIPGTRAPPTPTLDPASAGRSASAATSSSPYHDSFQPPQAPAGSSSSHRSRSSTREEASNQESNDRRMPSRSRSPNSRLARHLRDLMQQQGLDNSQMYSFPQYPSSFLRGDVFTVNELQPNGLINDGNVCPIISIILSFHRLRLKDYLKDLEYNPNLPTLVLYKMLQAMPSRSSFSIMQFVLTWNSSNLGTNITPGEHGDVIDILDSFLTELDIKRFSSRTKPVFSKYLASFNCTHCGKSYKDVERWDNQWNRMVPLLNIPSHEDPVNVWNLLSLFLASPVLTRCPDVACNHLIPDGVLNAVPGIFTVLAVNRLDLSDDHSAPVFLSNKLSIEPSSGSGGSETQALEGDLQSIICHRGQDSNHGHYVSYHHVTGQWYLNDDSRRCRPSTDPLLQLIPNESVNILFFKCSI